jgi:hypothetical protein
MKKKKIQFDAQKEVKRFSSMVIIQISQNVKIIF